MPKKYFQTIALIGTTILCVNTVSASKYGLDLSDCEIRKLTTRPSQLGRIGNQICDSYNYTSQYGKPTSHKMTNYACNTRDYLKCVMGSQSSCERRYQQKREETPLFICRPKNSSTKPWYK